MKGLMIDDAGFVEVTGRKLKKKILELLNQEDFKKSLEAICVLPERQVVNSLFSFFYNSNELIKWRAITAMGVVVTNLAETEIEYARVIMRRLLWNLNDESGGIGWGSPEAMGEIMARSHRLAEEYSKLLVSYIRPDGNFLEHEALQRGVLWGLGRLAHARSQFVKDAVPFILPFLESRDAYHRGFAAWAISSYHEESIKPLLLELINDESKIEIFLDMELVECTVGRLAGKSLSKQRAHAKIT